MRVLRVRSGVTALCVAVALTGLSGCDMASSGDPAARAGAGMDLFSTARRVVERDVEAPQVFNREEPGLWDGRPSLGGVWIAHPQASDPERVLIRNTQTGESVVGALFRRERENPGPRFQISSEAANALGILPGAPTNIAVVALRLERVEVQPQGQPEAAEAVAVAAVETDAEPQPQIQTAAAQPRPAAASAPAITAAPLAEPVVELAAAPAPAAAPVAEPRRGLAGLFTRREAPAPEPQLSAEVIQTAALPPVPAPVALALDRPFVQIGIFSIESNATNAAQQMRGAGLPVDVRRGRAGEREFWRVIVGPAPDATARAGYLRQVRGLGFADAYAVAR
jgi:rare lipoprotein A